MASDRTRYTQQIQKAAADHGLPFNMLEAQVLVESSGDTFAFRFEPRYFERYIRNNETALTRVPFGPIGACSYGLLQLMLETAWMLGFRGMPWELFMPDINLQYAALHMEQLLAWAKGDYRRALAAYNGGKGGNATYPLRSQAYVDKVHTYVEGVSL